MNQTFFELYKSGLPADKPPSWQLPPQDVTVLVTAPGLADREIEGMVAKSYGRSGLRWRLFNIQGKSIAYPYRGWHPQSWRFKPVE